MEIVYERCAGLDVYKKNVKACFSGPGAEGHRTKETRTYLTMTQNLLEMRAWLKEQGCTHIALEATGVYWKPIYNVLEGDFEILVVNAHHLKTVPGRKTDVKDSEWIADLLQHGLLQASFIPSAPQRELRDLTRYRTRLVEERAREINRLRDVPGRYQSESGRCRLRCDGQSVADDPVPSAQHLASWAGVCPGNHESAGKRLSGKARKGNPWLRRLLVQAAHAAAQSKNTYLAAQYQRLASRRGAKKAALAVAHSILVIIYHLLRDGSAYRDLGSTYFDERDRQAVEKRLVRRLERLGYQVDLRPRSEAG